MTPIRLQLEFLEVVLPYVRLVPPRVRKLLGEKMSKLMETELDAGEVEEERRHAKRAPAEGAAPRWVALFRMEAVLSGSTAAAGAGAGRTPAGARRKARGAASSTKGSTTQKRRANAKVHESPARSVGSRTLGSASMLKGTPNSMASAASQRRVLDLDNVSEDEDEDEDEEQEADEEEAKGVELGTAVRARGPASKASSRGMTSSAGLRDDVSVASEVRRPSLNNPLVLMPPRALSPPFRTPCFRHRSLSGAAAVVCRRRLGFGGCMAV